MSVTLSKVPENRSTTSAEQRSKRDTGPEKKSATRIEKEFAHLLHEIAHRLQNAFGMVQDVINQTLRNADLVKGAHRVLSGCVLALANAQDSGALIMP
jgi:two-component sensor histidine kinase